MANLKDNKKQAIVTAKDFNLILRVAKANWWVPILVLPVFYALASFYNYRLTTVYKASTEFLLKSDDTYYKANVLNDQSFYGFASYVDNLNEKRIIQSYDLASEVVNRLNDRLQVSYFIVGKVRTTEQFNGMPFNVVVNSINPSFYETVFDFKVLDNTKYEIDYNYNGVKQSKTGYFNKDLVDLDLSIRVDMNTNLSTQVQNSLQNIFYQFVIHSKEFLINRIRGNLKVENPEYTEILQVHLSDVLPDRAILILDTLNVVYSQSKLKSKFELNDRTVEYIDRQLNEITFSLKSIEDTMQNYKEKKSIIDLDWEQDDFLKKIGLYDGQKSQMELQLAALNDLEKYIIEDKDPQFLPPNVYIFEKQGFMYTAVMDLYSKQIELNKLYNIAKDGNPMINDLKSSIKKTRQDLLIYISNSRKAAMQQMESVNKEILSYVKEARLIPNKKRDMINIQRKATVSEQLYNFLLEKKATTKIARASIVPDLKIVEAPRYAGIESPDKTKNEKAFISAGLLVSLILIVIRTAMFTTISTVEHLKELTSIPLIGVLPYVKSAQNEGVVVDESPSSLIAESFRNLRTNLQYANVDNSAKTFLVTSYLPGEGKTFTSVNLAALLAKTGKKTVLLELDLHKPRVYQQFGLPKQNKGITTYITGQNTYEEIVSETSIPNLYALYSGPIPPNPSEFVLAEKMKDLLAKAKEEFEYVVIDTPPAGLLSDSLYLIQFVDASIFVLNARSSRKKVIDFLETVIADNQIKNVLLLLNAVAKPGRRYYYQGYGYSYGYGYGYGYGKGYGRGYGSKTYGRGRA